MTVPYWVQDAVFYQIFPDRFAISDAARGAPYLRPWGEPPTERGFQGGDLRGIMARFDYLLDLGINALYLNPIFQATSNHRYNTSDYYHIDPRLGSMADFHAFLDLAHGNGVRVILDGVFNHCGRGFFAFNDLLENEADSPYKDWFHVRQFPIDAYSPGETTDYLGWWKLKSLPKFNTDNPQTRRYLLDVARYWVEQGIDGWRLDVPNEIDDDAFWAEFRQVVRSANPDAYLVGEIWEADPRWVGPAHFDGLMNYPLRKALLAFLAGKSKSTQFGDALDKLLKANPRENTYAMYLPLGSHDTERIATLLGNDLRKVSLAFAFQFAFPGAPAVYYGDEIGMEGGEDPDCRRAFPWDESQWKGDLRRLVRRLAALRHQHPELRRGDFKRLASEDAHGVFAFARTLGEERLVAVFNASGIGRSVHLKVGEIGLRDGQIVRDLLGESETIVSGDTLPLNLPPWSAMWLH